MHQEVGKTPTHWLLFLLFLLLLLSPREGREGRERLFEKTAMEPSPSLACLCPLP